MQRSLDSAIVPAAVAAAAAAVDVAAYRVNALPLNIYSVPYGNVTQFH